MTCYHCNTELIPGGDHMYEDHGIDQEGIVTNLSCPECPTTVYVYHDLEPEKDETLLINILKEEK